MKSRDVILPVQTFASVCDLARERLAGRNVPAGSGDGSFSNSYGASWDAGVATLQDAIRLGETGWDAGNAAVAHAMELLDVDMAPRGGWDLDVVGAFPCIPAYLAGEPECMYARTAGPARLRVRLIFSASYLASVPASAGLVYAQACAAYAASLMGRGLDVAISAVAVNLDHATGTRSIMPLTVKEYGQEPDGSRIAVATHPAFFRRVGFAWREMSAAMPVGSRSSGYGATGYDCRQIEVLRSAIPDSSDERIVALPGLTDDQAKYTVQKMLDHFTAHAVDSAKVEI